MCAKRGTSLSAPGGTIVAVTTIRIPATGRLAGLVTVPELRAAGLGRRAVQESARSGRLLPVRRGAYAIPELLQALPGSGAFRDRALQIAAAVAVAGPGAAASHADAAFLHGLDLLDRPPVDLVFVTRPSGHERLRTDDRGIPDIRVRVAPLPAEQVIMRRGVPVTSVARTVTDLARTSPFRSGVVVADSALHARRTTDVELRAALHTCARWPGAARARQVVEFADGRSESAFESISRVAFRDGGLPPPDLQVWVGGEFGQVGRVDFLWREFRTIGEADGALKYADPDRARQQLRRDADLREAGFEVVQLRLRRGPGRRVRSGRPLPGRGSRSSAAGSRSRSGPCW